MQRHHVALITNCIEPNTISGPITNLNRKDRIISLVNNLNYLSYKSLFEEIYVVDPFIKNEKNKLEFGNILKKNGLVNRNIEYVIFSPRKDTEIEILQKGKGFSEMAMLIDSIIYINKKISNKETIIHKISGRYKVLNIKNIIKKNETKFKEGIQINIPISKLLKKCYSVMFSFKLNIDINIFNKCMLLINDEKYLYLEHAFYEVLNNDIKCTRNRFLPRFERSLIGGSKQGRYNLLKQLTNSLIYKLF